MRDPIQKPAAAAFLAAFLLFSCVTINIYFPAEKVESAAGEIVRDIRGETGGQQEEKTSPAKDGRTSLLQDVRLALSLTPAAWAREEVTVVSNASIRALKSKMKDRYPELKPYLAQGVLQEGDDGYLKVADTSGLDLRQKREVRSLLEAENQDRQQLYREVAAALKVDPADLSRVAEIFAKEWKKSAP